jgi:mono/diheme cytochrome c family protein
VRGCASLQAQTIIGTHAMRVKATKRFGPMLKEIVSGIGIAAACGAYLHGAAAGSRHVPAPPSRLSRLANPGPVSFQAPVANRSDTSLAAGRTLLDRYCVTCHSERLRTGGFVLERMSLDQIGENPAIWEKVVRKIRTGAMPPVGQPRPDQVTATAFAALLEGELDRATLTRPNPGRPALHRLNRAEYTNAIRDLLMLDVDSRALLPADESSYGFDNVADVLSVSPGLLEHYMSAAARISRLALGDPHIRPGVETYRISPVLFQNDRVSDDLPFGSRGGVAIRHQFPLDGEYIIKVRLQRTYLDAIRGLREANQLEVRLDGVPVKVFLVGGAPPDGSSPQRASELEANADAALDVRVVTKAGPRLVGITFLKRTIAPEGLGPARWPVMSFSYSGDKDAEMGVDSVDIDGPYHARVPAETPSRRRILLCQPTGRQDEEACPRTILQTLARRAFRRPVTEDDLSTLHDFYRRGTADGGFEAGIGLALQRILIDPDFLFRVERDPARLPPDTPYRITDLELASRLSFFLWSSIPDDELLSVAEAGGLSDRATLERQVRRMLADDRSRTLVDNFAGQWLYLRNMRGVTPDPNTFPDFDDNLRDAFRRETELFLQSMIADDRPINELLTAKHTFINERLARHYGIPNVYGSRFRKVTFEDDRRAGLLGHGSILTVTSYATRTSPVLRGKWLLENVLGAPPPPPPANVPDLPDRGEDGQATSVRQRMEQHRKNPVCASCHARMDPLGFALENFDAVGRWRTVSEANTPLDTSGAMPDGTRFDGPAEFRRVLQDHPEQFVTTVTEKLFTYALGRGLEYFDAPAVRQVMKQAVPNDYRWSSLIVGIVNSTPFQMRRSREP